MKKEKSSRKPVIYIALAFLFSFYALYNKALFNAGMTQFDQPIYASAVLVSIVFVVMTIMHFKQFGQMNFLLIVLAALIPFTYMISYFFAASSYLAVNEILISLVCFMLFVVGYFLAEQEKHLELAGDIILISGFAVVLFGLMNWFGNASFWGLFQYTSTTGQKQPVFQDAVWMAADGPRLASVFQYSNTYAGYLIALLLMSAIVMVFSEKKWIAYLSAFMIVPMMVSFFLTLSRGALVIMPLVVLFLLFFLKPAKQIQFVVYLLAGLVMSLLILSPVNRIGRELQLTADAGNYLIGCLIIIAASALYLLLYWAFNKYAFKPIDHLGSKIGSWKWSSVYLPIFAIILGIVSLLLLVSTGLSKLLPDSIRARIESISIGAQTVQERGTFYSDALKVFADYPVFGAGGGGWKALYQSYQSYPYISTNVHNYFLQHLVETGIIGFVFLAVFMIVIAFGYIHDLLRRNKDGQTFPYATFGLFVFAVSILAHSLIDFDMKYVYIASVVFFTFGVLSRHVNIQLPRFHYTKSIPWVVLVIGAFSLSLAGCLFIAHSNFQKSVSISKTSKEFYQIVQPLNSAAALSKNPDYLRQKFLLYQQAFEATSREEFKNTALDTIKKLQKYEYYDRSSYPEILKFYEHNQMHYEAKELLNRALVLFPWDIGIYELAIAKNVEWGNQEPGHESWDHAIAIYDQILERIRQLDEIPDGQLKGKPFAVTKTMAINISQILYFKGQYERSAQTLQPLVNVQQLNNENRAILRFYLASLQRLNKPDESLFNKFVSMYPEEKIQIDMLVSRN